MSPIATFNLLQQELMKHLGSTVVGFRRFFYRFFLAMLTAIASHGATYAASVREVRPQGDAEIIEVLAAKTKTKPASIEEAIYQAKIALQSSRELQDPRYLGRARALLNPWWGKVDASQEVLVLQATVEQSLHLFADARKTLAILTTKFPGNLQAWLTLASLDRLAGKYASALNSCERAASSSASGIAKIYADFCASDIQCHLRNEATSFRSLLIHLKRQRLNSEVLSWGYSLLAECEERTGEAEKALDAYRTSLALAPDNYTAISYVDALLRNKQAEKAMQVLGTLPKSDSVQLRIAHSMRMRNIAQWKLIHSDLLQRFAESISRGDDPRLHSRERAYAALWLSDDPKEALAQASLNIESQKEVIDWVLLFESLEKANDKAALRRYSTLLEITAVRDKRLVAWSAKK
jgi:tetratricopeptide (TPR) repeat protein